MLKKIKIEFQNQPIDLQKKSMILGILCIVLIIGMPLIAISDFKLGDIAQALIEMVLCIMMVVAFLMLRRGNYSVASNIAVIIVTLAMIFLAVVVEASSPQS